MARDTSSYTARLIKNHWLNGILIGVMVMMSLAFSKEALWLDQNLTLKNQAWRLFTGHLVHSNLAHLMMNISAFILIILNFESIGGWFKNLMVLACLCLGISFYLLFTTSMHYLGFSGVLHGFLVYCLILSFKTNKSLYGLLLLLMVIKLMAEQFDLPIDGGMNELLVGTPIAYGSHLSGAVIGTLLGFINLFYNFIHLFFKQKY